MRISPCFCQASEDGDITLEDDWRAFRARKIRQEQQRELNGDRCDAFWCSGREMLHGAFLQHESKRRSGSRAEDVGGPACRANRLLLRQQNPYLAEEGLWAEPADSVQAGTLLVATPRAAQRNPRYEQLVVLVLEHSGSRTSGVILNRPSMAVVDDLLGWGCVMRTRRRSQCKPMVCAPQVLPSTQCINRRSRVLPHAGGR